MKEAEEELADTEREKYIEDTEKLLDDLYLEYETILNSRLDNVDSLISDMITEINANASDIGNTIDSATKDVGYTLSNSMESIWLTNTSSIKDTIAMYVGGLPESQSKTIDALKSIKDSVDIMVGKIDGIATSKIKSKNTSSSTNTNSTNTKNQNTTNKTPNTPTKTPTSTSPTIKVGGKINASGAKIYDYAGDTSGETQYYKNDPIYKVLSEKNGYLKVLYHKLSSGVTGWFKKSDVKAYATGKKNFLDDEVAWTQENGTEFIVRPSDGAILTPVAKNDSVLNANASNNIWNMANSPADFIKENLNLGAASTPNNSNANNSVVQHFDNIVFSMPNVKNYGELLSELQKDPKFDKLIKAMTIDQIAGKSSLAKGKAVR